MTPQKSPKSLVTLRKNFLCNIMGKTYHRQSRRYDDEVSSGRSGKHAKHSNGKKTSGMRTLNNYVEENYDIDEDLFEDEIELNDEIHIQHTKHTT